MRPVVGAMPELPAVVGVDVVAAQHALLEDREGARGEALAVEEAGAEAAHDGAGRRARRGAGCRWAARACRPGRSASAAATRRRAARRASRRGGPAARALDHHGHDRRLPLLRADAGEGPRRGAPADVLGRWQRRRVARGGGGVVLGPAAVGVLHRHLGGEPEVGRAARPLEAVGVDDGALGLRVADAAGGREDRAPAGSAARAAASSACGPARGAAPPSRRRGPGRQLQVDVGPPGVELRVGEAPEGIRARGCGRAPPRPR